jgi:hypothetical protein
MAIILGMNSWYSRSAAADPLSHTPNKVEVMSIDLGIQRIFAVGEALPLHGRTAGTPTPKPVVTQPYPNLDSSLSDWAVRQHMGHSIAMRRKSLATSSGQLFKKVAEYITRPVTPPAAVQCMILHWKMRRMRFPIAPRSPCIARSARCCRLP